MPKPDSRMPHPREGLARKIFNHVFWRSGLSVRRTANRVASYYWSSRFKPISAMVRVKNEEEFLIPSILSIASLVDEIVFIDNLSTDATPLLIEKFKALLGKKVKAFSYPHEVAEMGAAYHSLQSMDPHSPGLLHHYYNWCRGKCRMPFLLKWDADMIALDGFEDAFEAFRASSDLQFSFGGENLAHDRVNVLTWDALIEPRVYPRLFSKFFYGRRDGCELLNEWVVPERTLLVGEPLYVHMRYCKGNASVLEETSPGFKEKARNIAGPASPHVLASLDKWLSRARLFSENQVNAFSTEYF